MTSLNTTTGWDANKQTGSNLTHSNIQGSSEAGSGRDGSRSQISPTTGTPSSSSPTPPSVTQAASELERNAYYKTYDPMVGVRIASTLGGFFLIVLLTLLYKSKCKHKHSREPSTLTLNNMPYPSIHPQQLMRGQANIQVNGRHDFGGGGSGGGGSPGGYPMPATLLDSSCYNYMNQVHPTNSHQPVYSNYYTSERPVKSPAVLLTTANSESSEEDLSLLSGTSQHGTCGGGPEVPPERKRTRNPLGPLPPCRQVVNIGDGESHSHHHLHPRSKSPPVGSRIGGKGNIDINVILPTPSISPSGSENFNMTTGHYYGEGNNNNNNNNNNPMGLFSRGNRGGGGGRGDRMLLVSRSLSSDNENDNSEASGVGASDSEAPMLPFGCGSSSLFSLDNLKYVDDTSSENIPTRASDADDQDQDQDTRSIGSDSVFACFEHNFDHIAPTYARRVSSVSGTSSGVLATHYGTSVPPPPPPQTSELIKVAAVGTGTGSGFGEGDEAEFRVTLTQAHAQVHHRDSFCSDLESVNDYMETGARRRSSSTQTTLSDLRHALGYSPSAWSGYVEGGGGVPSPGTTSLVSHTQHETPPKLSVPRRRRSLSPHNIVTTVKTTSASNSGNLLSPATATTVVSPNSNSTSAFLSGTLHPLPLAAGGPAGASTPTTPTNPPIMMLSPTSVLSPTSPLISPSRITRKRSFEAARKSLSLQYEEKTEACSLFAGSSNETTPTN